MNFYQEAINEYEQIIARRLETCTIYNNLGLIYSKLGKKQRAMECYETALELSPEHEYTYNNIANLYFYEKDFESAITNALKALEINCKFRQAADLLAIIYTLLDDKENADKYFHIAISSGSNPNSLKYAIEHYKQEL
jgi:tetratricopeptide (TPR) repeat protein